MQQRFLLQILLLAQHVSGITMPIIRSSRVLYSGCCLWYFVPWFFTVLVLPNRGNFQFFEPASYFQRVINSEIYHQYENVMFRCICKIWKMCYELHHVCLAVHLSVCLSVWNNSATTGRIFIKFECIKFNENLSKICQNNLSFTKVW